MSQAEGEGITLTGTSSQQPESNGQRRHVNSAIKWSVACLHTRNYNLPHPCALWRRTAPNIPRNGSVGSAGQRQRVSSRKPSPAANSSRERERERQQQERSRDQPDTGRGREVEPWHYAAHCTRSSSKTTCLTRHTRVLFTVPTRTQLSYTHTPSLRAVRIWNHTSGGAGKGTN